MTRDIRVALLIGLAFITLFGIVLGRRSLKLSSATASEPVAPPAGPTDRPGPEVAAIEVQRDDDRPVLSPARPLTRRVAASEPARAPVPSPPAEVAAAAPPPARPDPVVVGYAAAPTRPAEAAPPPAPTPAPTLPEPARPPVALTFVSGPDPAPAVALRRTYCVQPGDGLRKIARKVYGPEHEDKYVLIHEANKDRLRDPQKVIVGQVLTIPPLAVAPAPASGAVAPRTAPTPPAPAPRPREVATGAVTPRAASTPAPGPASRTRAATPGATAPARPPYVEASAERLGDTLRRMAPGRSARQIVVDKGDTLIKIAAREMGSGSAANVRKLIEANKGALNDPNHVVPGLKLRIPQ